MALYAMVWPSRPPVCQSAKLPPACPTAIMNIIIPTTIAVNLHLKKSKYLHSIVCACVPAVEYTIPYIQMEKQ